MRAPAALPALLALASLCGCAGDAAPAVVPLAGALIRAPAGPLAGSEVALVEDARGRWLAYPLERGSLSSLGVPGAWRAPRLAAGHGRPADGSAPAVLAAGGAVRPGLDVGAAAKSILALPDGAFAVGGDAVYLRADDPSALPEAAQVREFVGDASAAAVGRVRLGGYSGRGAVLLPGDAYETALPDGAGGATLRAITACAATPAGPGPAVFRVLCDGVEIARLEQPSGLRATATARAIPLPADAGGATLRVVVEGPPAPCGLFDPRVGPADPGDVASARPDLVVFLADTYRADNLACYGGDPRIAPNLNALARESLRFLRAWSPASWTLPSHASLFSGLYPYQSTVVRGTSALPDEIESLAERFAAAGYRTGAVTDSACVSAAYGLDQGFAWFDEEWSTAERTLAAVERFLEGDDGRPQLLFVQSYRAHAPYLVGPEAARQVGGLETDLAACLALFDRVRPRVGTPREELPEDARADALALERMYRGSSAELDALFGRVRALLLAHGLADAALIVASDHGEAFLEHGLLEHENVVFEETTRVPLLIHRPGVAGADRADAGSLVDLPRTLAELAGIAPAPGWGGRSLLAAPDLDPAAFSFECSRLSGESRVSVVDGDLKMIAPVLAADARAAPPGQVFDLALDPGERDAVRDEAIWRERWDARAPRLTELLQPRATSATAQLSEAEQAVMDALGYTGD